MKKLLRKLYCGGVLVALMSFEPIAAQTLENRLKGHPSPYLAAHANDEVNWQTWSRHAFEQAKQHKSLLLVSVGYFACHWCHVMQRESFKSGPAAALINEMSIPIKVDRELRPELDAHLMAFSERTTGAAGWPLQVLLTPDGYPLFAFGYQPQADLVRLLTAARKQWAEDQNTLREVARHAHLELTKSLTGGAAFALTQGNALGAYNALLAQIMEVADPLAGGFGQQSKFPSTPQLDALVYAESVASDPERRMFLLMTLHQMAALGLRDQIGGGFFRYVTDPNWTTPHFEKMLYDNAQLMTLLTDVFLATGTPLYATRIRETADWLFREMMAEGDAFAASL
ncbi:MAG: thioredoxin domain-containing protein, partial [Gammaproteobacteria bacterium]